MSANRCTFVRTDDILADPHGKRAKGGSSLAAGTITVFALGAVLLCGCPLSAQDNSTPMVNRATAFAVSAPLRELAKMPAQPTYSLVVPELAREVRRQPAGQVVDTVEQSFVIPESNFSIGLNFQGVGNGFPGYQVQDNYPMATMAVGDTQVVQWVVNSYAVFDKTTGTALTGAIDSHTLFGSLGSTCALNLTTNASVHWDRAAHRWLLARNVSNETCVAVSTSADATGSYYLFAYPQAGSSSTDLTAWGIWSNGYYKSQDRRQGTAYVGADLCAYNRAKMLVGDASAEEICLPLSENDFSPSPTDIDSNVPPPSGQDELFAALWDETHLAVYSMHADFANPANSFVTGNNGSQLIEVPAFTFACNGTLPGYCVPQKDTNIQLAVIGGRFGGHRIAYWDDNPPLGTRVSPLFPAPLQHWYMVHDTTASGGSQAPRWYEFTATQRSTPVTGIHLSQSGTFAPDANHRWTAAIARDKSYDILLGYSVSSLNMYPSIAVAGRTLHDPPGTLENEVTVINGTGSETSNPGYWGWFSAMSIDPDGCTFFYTNEYYLTTAVRNWSTQISSLKFNNCH